MSSDHRVWDSGLQPERTALAWKRLSLALVAIALLATRLTWPAFGVWAIPPTAAVAAVAIVLYSAAQHRYLGHHTHLTAGTPRSLPDGRLILVTALTAGVVALGGLAFVITAGG